MQQVRQNVRQKFSQQVSQAVIKMLLRQLVSKSGGSTSNNNKVRKSHIPWSAGQLSTSEAVGSHTYLGQPASCRQVRQ